MQFTELIEKYSVEKMFLGLEKLHMIEDQDGKFKELERTRKQKEILDALSSMSCGKTSEIRFYNLFKSMNYLRRMKSCTEEVNFALSS